MIVSKGKSRNQEVHKVLTGAYFIPKSSTKAEYRYNKNFLSLPEYDQDIGEAWAIMEHIKRHPHLVKPFILLLKERVSKRFGGKPMYECEVFIHFTPTDICEALLALEKKFNCREKEREQVYLNAQTVQ